VHCFVGSTQFGEHSVERCNPRVEFPKFEHQIAYQLLHTGLKPLAFFFPQPSIQLCPAFAANQGRARKELIDERGSLADESISRAVE